MLPLVAVVGRPNVGKSTLVNRLASTSKAIVSKEPGVTRDRNYIKTDWCGKNFTLIDTGGLDFFSSKYKLSLKKAVAEQALLAVKEAHVVIFVVDGKEGLVSSDLEIAEILRKSNKPVLLVINKIDASSWEEKKNDFYQLGLGEPIPISSLHGIGIGDFLDELVKLLPELPEAEEKETFSVAIVGRPNVGKSTLLNQLLKDKRAIVSEIPGTTRDALDTLFRFDGEILRLIDTAGIRRKKKIRSSVDYYGYVRTLRVLGEAELALVLLDATEGPTREDQKIAGFVKERGCGCILLLNKWDLVKREAREALIEEAMAKLRFVSYAPLLPISALTGYGIKNLLTSIKEVKKNCFQRAPTAEINKLVAEIMAEGHLPTKKRKRLKMFYATQTGVAPPSLVFFVNNPSLIDASYKSYVEKKLRENFSFFGVPLRIFFRKRRKT